LDISSNALTHAGIAFIAEALGTPDAGERAVDVQVTRLRRKIEPDPREPRFLHTIRHKGYVLRPGP
jgi:two-component system phosphate regulon response regulator OmpR